MGRSPDIDRWTILCPCVLFLGIGSWLRHVNAQCNPRAFAVLLEMLSTDQNRKIWKAHTHRAQNWIHCGIFPFPFRNILFTLQLSQVLNYKQLCHWAKLPHATFFQKYCYHWMQQCTFCGVESFLSLVLKASHRSFTTSKSYSKPVFQDKVSMYS